MESRSRRRSGHDSFDGEEQIHQIWFDWNEVLSRSRLRSRFLTRFEEIWRLLNRPQITWKCIFIPIAFNMSWTFDTTIYHGIFNCIIKKHCLYLIIRINCAAAAYAGFENSDCWQTEIVRLVSSFYLLLHNCPLPCRWAALLPVVSMLDDGRWRYCCYSAGELWRPVDGFHFRYRNRPDRCLSGWCPTIRTCVKCSRVFFLISVAVVHCNLNSLADFFVEVESSGTLFIVAVVSACAPAISRIPIPGLIVGFAFATVVDIWTLATARIRHVLLIDRAMLINLKMTIRIMYYWKC